MEILRAILDRSKKVKFYPDSLIDWEEIRSHLGSDIRGDCVSVAFAVKVELMQRGVLTENITFMSNRGQKLFHVWVEVNGCVVDEPSIRKQAVPLNIYKHGARDQEIEDFWKKIMSGDGWDELTSAQIL